MFNRGARKIGGNGFSHLATYREVHAPTCQINLVSKRGTQGLARIVISPPDFHGKTIVFKRINNRLTRGIWHNG